MKPSKTLLTALFLAVATTFSVATISIAAGDRCTAVDRGFNQVKRQSGTASCTASTSSTATAHGSFANATAYTDSVAHMDGDCPKAGACTAYAIVSSRAINIESRQASANYDSRAEADHALKAYAEQGSRAEAEGAGSCAYATYGSTAIARNGGVAVVLDGATVVADGTTETSPKPLPNGRTAASYCLVPSTD